MNNSPAPSHVAIVLLSILGLFAAMLSEAEAASPQSAGILYATVDYQLHTVSINGQNFTHIPGTPAVQLAGTALQITSLTDNNIAAFLPPSLSPGTYLLTLTGGTVVSVLIDDAWLTLGAAGPKGDKGDTGPQGVQGVKGDTGPQGAQGVKGVKGDTGDRGPRGFEGIQGAQGLQGPQGEQGAPGLNGVNGIDGAPGPAGINGAVFATINSTITDMTFNSTGPFMANFTIGTELTLPPPDPANPLDLAVCFPQATFYLDGAQGFITLPHFTGAGPGRAFFQLTNTQVFSPSPGLHTLQIVVAGGGPLCGLLAVGPSQMAVLGSVTMP